MDNLNNELLNINKVIGKIREENEHLQHLKGRYVEHAKELSDIVKVLKDLTERVTKLSIEIDPLQMVHKVRSSTIKRKEQVEELYKMMQAGTHVTSELIKNTYNTTGGIEFYIISKLRQKPGVQEVKDGINVRLFV